MKIKKYEITVEENDGKKIMKRVNDGFNPLELIGVLEYSIREIRDQINGKYQPDEVERVVVKDKVSPKQEQVITSKDIDKMLERAKFFTATSKKIKPKKTMPVLVKVKDGPLGCRDGNGNNCYHLANKTCPNAECLTGDFIYLEKSKVNPKQKRKHKAVELKVGDRVKVINKGTSDYKKGDKGRVLDVENDIEVVGDKYNHSQYFYRNQLVKLPTKKS